MVEHRLTRETIATEEALRALIGEPMEIVCAKVATRLNALTRQFIERSPFILLATSDADGHLDVSPRGDPTGFVCIVEHPHRLHHQRQSRVRRHCGVIVGDLDRIRKHSCRAPTHGNYKTHGERINNRNRCTRAREAKKQQGCAHAARSPACALSACRALRAS